MQIADVFFSLVASLTFWACTVNRVRTIVPSYTIASDGSRTIVYNNRPRLFMVDSLSDGMTLSTDHFQVELDTILCHW